VPPPLALHDIDDAAAFVAALVNRSGLSPSWSDREDLAQSLLIVAWELSLRYHPGGISFSTFAGRTLRLRIVDWQRSGAGGRTTWKFRNADGSLRVHERQLPQLVPLDDSARDRLEQSLATRNGDREDGGDLGLGGLDGGGDRQRALDYETLGLDPPRRAA
jgi:DNA-directed RNA polymerase specialized sigma24 family protein